MSPIYTIFAAKLKKYTKVETFEMIAKTFQGLEEVLAKELIELGANDIQIGRRMVSFTGDKMMLYKANFCLRTAIRILKPIKTFNAKDADEIYDLLKTFSWEKYMNVSTSFAVDAVVYSNEFRHSKFVAYRVKDAIADYFREKEGKRPSVQVSNPDLLFHIHIAQEQCTLSLDSSGESLHRRGYRQEAFGAPLNEVLAAGMILLTGWKGECDFYDPMCGSGTLPIEAALIARNIAPGIFRKEFAFEKWEDFDQDLFDSIYNDDSAEREFEHHIYGYDIDWKAVNIAKTNVRAAGMQHIVTIDHGDFKEFEQPEEKAIMVTNPPYGERLRPDNLYDLYRTIGERLKHAFQGNEAWIISYKEECFFKIGLKASVIVSLFNGALPCEFRKYELFSGRFSEFREGGEQLNKDERPIRERRPLHLRQAAEEKTTDTEEKKEDHIFESHDEEREYYSKLDRHKQFVRLQEDKRRRSERERRGERREYRGERRDFSDGKREYQSERKEYSNEKREYKGERREYKGERKEYSSERRDFKGHGKDFKDRKGGFHKKEDRFGKDGERRGSRSDFRKGGFKKDGFKKTFYKSNSNNNENNND